MAIGDVVECPKEIIRSSAKNGALQLTSTRISHGLARSLRCMLLPGQARQRETLQNEGLRVYRRSLLEGPLSVTFALEMRRKELSCVSCVEKVRRT